MANQDWDIKLEDIDSDKNLSKRKLPLVVVAGLLIGFQFTGALISEINTFIFKIEFSHQEGLSLVFFMALIYLLFRYISYAHKYHRKLMELAYMDLVKEGYIHTAFRDEQGAQEGIGGLVASKNKKNGVNANSFLSHGLSFELRYIRTGFFKRHFMYQIVHDEVYSGEHDEYENVFNVYGWRRFLMVLLIELKVRVNSLLIHREFLDVLGPYFISVLALISFVSPEFVVHVLALAGIKDAG